MSQNDLVIANQSFPSFRTDLNSALQAINSSHSGSSIPSGAVAGTIWLDTTSATSPTLKFYDGTDSISLAIIDYTNNTVNWLDSSISYNTTATSAGTLTLTVSSSYKQYLTGTTTHTVVLPVTSTLTLGQTFQIHNNSTGSVTINSSGANLVGTLVADTTAEITCILTSGTTAASWDYYSITPTSLATPLAVVGNATSGSEIRLPEDTDNGSNYVAIKAPDTIASNLTLTLPSADGTSGQVLQTDGSGVLSFVSSSAANTPAFLAYRTTAQSLSPNTDTKVQWNTELFDTGNCYDNSTNFRFTPTTSGKYLVTHCLTVNNSSGVNVDAIFVEIFKNGSNAHPSITRQGINSTTTANDFNELSFCVTKIFELNGTSDYVEAFVHAAGTNLQTDGASNEVGFFQAFKLIE